MAGSPNRPPRHSRQSSFASSGEMLSPDYRPYEVNSPPVEMGQLPQQDSRGPYRRETQPELSPATTISQIASASSSPLLSRGWDTPAQGNFPPASYSTHKWDRKSAYSFRSVETGSTATGDRFRLGSRHDSTTYDLIERRARELAQWKIDLRVPSLMVVLFICGVIGAAGHHLFYRSLDGKPATDQLKMVRFGTALAFFTKATLVGSVVLAHRQRIWHTLRNKAMTIGAIDGLFSVTEDLIGFGNWEMIRKAKLATLMAAATW